MIADLQPYPSYRPSGIPWLGDAPGHWEVTRLKAVARIRYGLGQPPRESPTGLPLIRATNVSRGRIVETDLLRIDPEDVPIGRDAFLREKEIIVVRSGAYTADSAIVPKAYAGSVAGYDMVLTATKAIPEFLAAALLAGYLRDDQLVIASTRAAQPHLNVDELGTSVVLLPTLEEQTAIVRFLDHADEQIQRYIAGKERLIALLEEERQALVHQAVTRGLDLSVRLKPSGVEWLGEVPDHWEVARFARQVNIAEGQVDPKIEPYVSMLMIAPNHVEPGTGRLLSRETAYEQGAISGKYLCRAGDVVYSKIRPALAKVLLAPTDCLCSADMYPLRPRNSLQSDYLFWLLLSTGFTAWSVLQSDRVAMPKINRQTLNNVHIPLPPISEQASIVQHLIEATAKASRAIDRARRQIDLMNEYRTRLIADVVTGKVDVRNA